MSSLNKQILNIAVPAVLGFLGIIVFEAVDIYWIGKLGSKAVAGAGGAAFILWTCYAVMKLSTTGCATFVAQKYGAGDTAGVYKVVRDSFWLTILVSVVVAVLLYFSVEHVFRFMGLDEETQKFAMDYFIVMIFGFPIVYLFHLTEFIFNGYGKTKPSMVILLLVLSLNIGLDPILIFGLFGFPKFGIMGAAIATVVCELLGIVLSVVYLRRKELISPLLEFLKFDLGEFAVFLRLGLPSALTNVVWCAVFPVLTVIISRFGMEPLAGLNVALKFEGFAYFVGAGFGVAITALIGQSYGRKEYKEIPKIMARGVLLVTLFLLPLSILFVTIPETLVSILNSDPEVIKHGGEYLRIVGYLEIFLGWELVIEGAFNGLGNTKPYMFVRVPLTIARIPMAWFFAIYLQMGTIGVWWAISISTFMKAVLLFFAFKTNKENRKTFSYS